MSALDDIVHLCLLLLLLVALPLWIGKTLRNDATPRADGAGPAEIEG